MKIFKRELIETRTVKLNFEIEYKELKNLIRISSGTFGIVYKANWRETQVAVKMIRTDCMKEAVIKDFLNECYCMESLRHPNVCLFYGCCTKSPSKTALVMEYCPNNTLWSFLHNKKYPLNWSKRLSWAVDIAKGMYYLHSFPVPVLHRDLKSLNILLDKDLIAKLADFGWTRLLDVDMTGSIGTFQWMAPEVIIENQYTEKADIYSYGIILWEIASREPPYNG